MGKEGFASLRHIGHLMLFARKEVEQDDIDASFRIDMGHHETLAKRDVRFCTRSANGSDNLANINLVIVLELLGFHFSDHVAQAV